jgi:hypothetical protein
MVSSVQTSTVKRLYVDEGLSRDKIALMLGLPHSIITNALRRAEVQIRPPRTPQIVTELTTSTPGPSRIGYEGSHIVARHQIRLTLRLAYLLGWIIGDGYVNRREIDAIVSLRECEILEPPFKRLLMRFGSVFVVPRHGTHIIRCNSTKLARVFCTAEGDRYWRNIDFILSSPRFAAAFLAGLWDADGGIFHEANGAFRAHLYSSNVRLVERVVRALMNLFGIEATVYKRRTSTLPSNSRILARSDRFDLYIPARSNNLWAQHIGKNMILPWKRP